MCFKRKKSKKILILGRTKNCSEFKTQLEAHSGICQTSKMEPLLKTIKYLTDCSPLLLFYTPWKHQKIFRLSDIFRGYRKGTPGCNGLNNTFIRNARLKLAINQAKTKQHQRLIFCYLKIIRFLHSRYHPKIIEDIVKNV